MNSAKEQHPVSRVEQHPEFSLERISRLVSDLERELANAPPDIPNVQQLREEIVTLKQVLASPDKRESGVGERLHAILGGLQDMTQRAEGEVLKDSPYIAEIGRILGLV